MPPVGGLIIRALTSTETVSTMREIVRFRDVLDASLKKMLDIIQK
jgi:hypothetical protein